MKNLNEYLLNMIESMGVDSEDGLFEVYVESLIDIIECVKEGNCNECEFGEIEFEDDDDDNEPGYEYEDGETDDLNEPGDDTESEYGDDILMNPETKERLKKVMWNDKRNPMIHIVNDEDEVDEQASAYRTAQLAQRNAAIGKGVNFLKKKIGMKVVDKGKQAAELMAKSLKRPLV